MAWTRQWQEMGRGECLKGTGAEQTGLAVGLDVGLRERGPILGLAASLPYPSSRSGTIREFRHPGCWNLEPHSGLILGIPDIGTLPRLT